MFRLLCFATVLARQGVALDPDYRCNVTTMVELMTRIEAGCDQLVSVRWPPVTKFSDETQLG